MSWQTDFFEIDVTQVAVPDLDASWRSSKGYQRAEFEAWTRDLREAQARIAKGWKPEDFERLNRSADVRDRALETAYGKFYGYGRDRASADHLKVDWQDNRYEITNGRHRIWMAKAHGLQTVPAIVAAPDAETLQALRARGEQVRVAREASRAHLPGWERRPDGDQRRLRSPNLDRRR
jgi:hypothetical protein